MFRNNFDRRIEHIKHVFEKRKKINLNQSKIKNVQAALVVLGEGIVLFAPGRGLISTRHDFILAASTFFCEI